MKKFKIWFKNLDNGFYRFQEIETYDFETASKCGGFSKKSREIITQITLIEAA
jgi:hypothetical protein